MVVEQSDSNNTATSLDAAPQATAKASWLALFRDGDAFISIMLTGGVAIHALSLRVVSTVLPSVVEEIGGLRFFAWSTTVAIVSAIWGAAFAASSVRWRGLRNSYRIALMLFAVGSIGCALAPDMGVLLTGRLFQGLGGGLLTALAYTTIRRVFPEYLRTRAIVLVSGIWGVAALSGPLLGGVLAGWGFWRWAFWIDVPVALAVGVLAEFALPVTAEPNEGRATTRVASASGRLVLLGSSVLAVAVGGVSGDTVTSGIGLAIGTVLLALLLRIERKADASSFRLLPIDAYRPRSVLGALSMALMVGTTTAVLYLPYAATEIGGYSPVVGGYLSAILSLSWTATAFLSGSAEGIWADRSIIAGPVTVFLGLVLTGWALNLGWFVFVGVALLLVGGGIGIAWAHLGNLMMGHARDNEHDVSSAFITTNQMIAQAFASALAGMIANLVGFGDPTLGSSGVMPAISCLFLCFAFIAAVSIPISVKAVRLSALRQRNTVLEREPQPTTLASLDDHLLADIGVERERRVWAADASVDIPKNNDEDSQGHGPQDDNLHPGFGFPHKRLPNLRGSDL
jgi:MFS family permease